MEYERLIRLSVESERSQQSIPGSPFHRYVFDDGTVWTEFYRTTDGYMLRFPDIADFEVTSSGDRVVAHPVVGADSTTVEHLYLNQLVPLALSRQGRPAFHASAVTVPGGAIVFLGKTGMGKSTLATSFALEGAAFLTDDALLIDESDGIRAMPSHPSVRLWKDSVDAMIPMETTQGTTVGYSDKARLLAGGVLNHANEPAPLLAAFVLSDERADDVGISPLEGAERHMAWIENSFLLDTEDPDLLVRHFDWTHRIAAGVPTFRLRYPRAYGMLATVRACVTQHLAGLRLP